MSLSFKDIRILLTGLTKYETELNFDKKEIQALKNRLKKELSKYDE